MSEQQQPKEHCEHECVCDNFHPEYDPDYQEICNNSDCPHDTRSRPHPTPRAPTLNELSAINAALQKLYPDDFALQLNAKQLSQEQKEHDAAIAGQASREEREQVLDELYAWLSEKVEPHEAAMRVLTIGEKIKSLREGAGK